VVGTTNKPARTKPTSHASGISTLRLVGEKTGARREHLPSGAEAGGRVLAQVFVPLGL
jgi:hypothetical protein